MVASSTKDAALIAAREAKTRLLDLEFARKSGELIDRSLAERTAFAFMRAERDSWLAWVARTVPVLAGELGCNEHALSCALDRHVREHLQHLSETSIDAMMIERGT
jgi:hypothetical protein